MHAVEAGIEVSAACHNRRSTIDKNEVSVLLGL